MMTRSAVASAHLARLPVAGPRATCAPSPALPRTGSPVRWSASQRHTFRSVCVRLLQHSAYYENSGTMRLASCRPSHVPHQRNVLARRRCPIHALACIHYASSIGQGVAWKKADAIPTDGVGYTDVLPTSERFHHWTLGFGQCSSHPIAQAWQDRTIHVFCYAPLSDHALVPSPFRV